MLSRKGYAGTRLTDVADQAEIQAPAIYYYFQSRDDLIEEVMWSGIAHMRDHMARCSPRCRPTPIRSTASTPRSRRTCGTPWRSPTTPPRRSAMRARSRRPSRIRYTAEASQYGDMWRKLLQDADNGGLLRPDLDPMAARMLVLGALNWAAEWWNPRRGSLDAVVRTAQSLVRHGLGPVPAVGHDDLAGAHGSTARKSRARRRPMIG